MEWGLWGLVCLVVLATIWIFNTFVRLRNQVRTAWGDVDVQLARRHALVPSLVNVVSGYADHEQRILNEIVRLRSEALSLDSPAQLAGVEESLEQNVHRILLLQEAYPDLKASTNFLKLQQQLVEIEDRLQYARRFYNGAVRDYNDALQMFPNRVLAGPLGFQLAEFFKVELLAREAPQVSLSSKVKIDTKNTQATRYSREER